jgi:hypothetical protein
MYMANNKEVKIMSHFSVLVIGSNVEELLSSYDENLEDVEPYVDKSADQIQLDFENHKRGIITANKDPAKLNSFERLTLSLSVVTDEWIKEWSGQELDEYGNTLSTYNPDSKWDWYEIGGRWTGSLKLKRGKKGIRGKPGIFGDHTERDPTRCDQCKIKDVNWKVMHKEAQDGVKSTWDTLMNPGDNCMYRPSYVDIQRQLHIDMYGTKEEYVKRRGIWTTYALLSESDGWVEPGQMGWFGCSSADTKSRDEYDEKFVQIVKSYPKDTMITVVDCHI